MPKDALQESTQDRLAEMMTNAMGAAIGDLLHDPSVEELRANPDGRLWCVRDGMRHDTKKTLGTAARRQLINIVAKSRNSFLMWKDVLKSSCSGFITSRGITK